jgi:hypothetical protein
MNFKFLRGKESYTLQLEPIQQLSINRRLFTPANVEFCFQFDDDEPIMFGNGPNECTIRLSPSEDGYIIFTDTNNRKFKLFARERQDG